MIGLGGGFLMISPKLRGDVAQAVGLGLTTLDAYSPWSYMGAALFILAVFVISCYRGSVAH